MGISKRIGFFLSVQRNAECDFGEESLCNFVVDDVQTLKWRTQDTSSTESQQYQPPTDHTIGRRK